MDAFLFKKGMFLTVSAALLACSTTAASLTADEANRWDDAEIEVESEVYVDGPEDIELVMPKIFAGIEGAVVELGGHAKVSVGSVAEGSQAAKAGLKKGDIIIGYDGKAIDSSAGLMKARKAAEGKDGDIEVIIRRGDEIKVVSMKPGKIGISLVSDSVSYKKIAGPDGHRIALKTMRQAEEAMERIRVHGVDDAMKEMEKLRRRMEELRGERTRLREERVGRELPRIVRPRVERERVEADDVRDEVKELRSVVKKLLERLESLEEKPRR